jgi:hypothetical protein
MKEELLKLPSDLVVRITEKAEMEGLSITDLLYSLLENQYGIDTELQQSIQMYNGF